MAENEITEEGVNISGLLLPKNDIVFQTLFTRQKDFCITGRKYIQQV